MNEKNISGLLIEDDPDDTMLLMEIMAQPDWPALKFTFVCAENLKAGLKILEKDNIEVVLLDLTLPDSRGIETVSKVHSLAPDVPIVVLTGLANESLGLEAVMQGAQDYQVKGEINGHALKRTISYAVERHRSLFHLKNIIESAPDGMVIVNAKKIILYMNSAAMALLGGSANELLGKPFPYPLSKNNFCELLRIPVQGGGERIMETRTAEIEWKNEPAAIISIHDITELRRVEQIKAEIIERRNMDKLKDELMSAVSHEMRNPLTIIKAAGGNLKEGLAGSLSRQQANIVSLQYNNILRLEKIVDHILDLSRLESGRAQINLQKVDAAQLIRDTLNGFRLVASEQNLMIQQEIPEDLPMLNADPELFIQVLSNLIDNAMRFTESKILVKAETVVGDEVASKTMQANAVTGVLTARKYIQVSVIDDGEGIPKERIEELFNKFIQVNRNSRGEGYKGTGLGLAICKEIVERQKGKIWVESVWGKGAQFHFMLPQYESPLPSNE